MNNASLEGGNVCSKNLFSLAPKRIAALSRSCQQHEHIKYGQLNFMSPHAVRREAVDAALHLRQHTQARTLAGVEDTSAQNPAQSGRSNGKGADLLFCCFHLLQRRCENCSVSETTMTENISIRALEPLPEEEKRRNQQASKQQESFLNRAGAKPGQGILAVVRVEVPSRIINNPGGEGTDPMPLPPLPTNPA